MGEESGHISVLAREVCDALHGALPEGEDAARGVFVDATCGLGGHTLEVLRRFRPALAIVIDRDPHALARARARLADVATPLHFVHDNFSNIAAVLNAHGVTKVDAVIADLGVSSIQLDMGERGFSFRQDAPLDMRMNPEAGETAAQLLARIDVRELTQVLREYGEESDAPRIARAIVNARPTTTSQLANVTAAAMSQKQRRKIGLRINPATRTFQAIRIRVNDELGELDQFLRDAPQLLNDRGRLAIITFHSLEDRRVKRSFTKRTRVDELPGLPVLEHEREQALFAVPRAFSGGVTASPTEVAANPRARSARVRVLHRVATA